MKQSAIDQPEFPDGFDPVNAAPAYLRVHGVSKWTAVLAVWFGFASIGMLSASISFATTSFLLQKVNARGALSFDDEPLDDEDLTAIGEARAAADEGRSASDYVSLDTYFEQRRNRAS